MKKTAVINVPRLEPHRPPPGPATICKVCELIGHEVSAHDLNIEFFHFCKKRGADYHGFDQVWNQVTELDAQQKLIVDDFLEYWCKLIAEKNYDHILLSVFGQSGNQFAEMFLSKIRPLTTARIVAGGMGIGVVALTDAEDCYGYRLQQRGLIDDFIVGEGEEAVVKYFQGITWPGINNTQLNQLENLDDLPQPDYSYYNLDDYDYLIPNKKEVYITGSRGCVRKCTYCDVEKFWPKYRYRSGQNIAQEIIHNYETHGITRFYFTDSLVNGSLKAFIDMCESLANYNFDQPISWSGQFIFREKRTVPKNQFELMQRAGADILYVGLETGSDKVRASMGKKFTNEDIDWQLEECSRYKIKVVPLLFTGYITETIEDHHDNLKMFSRWQKYVADGTITGAELGSGLLILPGAPVERMIESHGIEFMLDHNNEPGQGLWWSSSNPDLTIEERVRRKLEVHKTAIQHCWPVWRQTTRLRELKEFILKNKLNTLAQKQFYRLISTSNDQKILEPGRVEN